MDEFANELPEGAKVAIEASTSGIFAYEYLDEGGIEHLAHPVYVKPFAKKHVKTDKVDAFCAFRQLIRKFVQTFACLPYFKKVFFM